MTKDAFLDRVRHALKRRHGQPTEAPPALLTPLKDWDSTELVAPFIHELELIGVTVHRVETLEKAKTALREIVANLGARTCLTGSDPTALEVTEGLTLPLADNPADADVGITGVRYGVAATGTLVLTSEAGRRASLLPMNHIAVMRVSQLLPSMAEALEDHYQEMPTAWVQATGPSRTADIELTLTIGVHGPGVVHVILIG